MSNGTLCFLKGIPVAKSNPNISSSNTAITSDVIVKPLAIRRIPELKELMLLLMRCRFLSIICVKTAVIRFRETEADWRHNPPPEC
jgi:hypothetical protein